jgi:hypothetical protein
VEEGGLRLIEEILIEGLRCNGVSESQFALSFRRDDQDWLVWATVTNNYVVAKFEWQTLIDAVIHCEPHEIILGVKVLVEALLDLQPAIGCF